MFSISPICAFRDNYIWLITLPGQRALVVDPGDAVPVIEALETANLTLCAILLTHHHSDHAGGIDVLREWSLRLGQPLTVYGAASSRYSDVVCREGDRLDIEGLCVQVLEVPGHTLDHLAFVIADALFCGDTLFSAGCGRLFEGTGADLFASLAKLSALPQDTRVYCAHEYTQSNLRFALQVEPDNPALIAYAAEVDTLRAKGIPSLPSSLGRETSVNPFLRTHSATIRAAVASHWQRPVEDGVTCLTLLRQWKDNA